MLTNIEQWPVSRPLPYARNARKIPAKAVEKVASSIAEFGWRQPIVVDKEGVIIVGHTRLLAAKKLGFETVPVHIAADLTEGQVKAYRLMDNRSHEEASWDFDLIAAELCDLQAFAVDLSLTGFDAAELKDLMEQEPTAGLTDEDAAPEVTEDPTTVRGDIWLLGEHRLLCGDAVVAADIEKLMAGEQADLVFTDPPYNVAYEGGTEQKLTIMNDAMTDDQFRQFLKDTFGSYRIATKPGASLYVCHPSLYQREFQEAIEHAGFNVRCQIIWAKNTFAWGFGRYKFQHEPIFYCHVKGESDAWYGDKSQSTLWQEKKPAANRLHPTMKPVELIERALVNSSKKGDIVLDLFGGSGSTMIAAERMGRKARLLELDPRYCDVIVKRYQDFSGKPVFHAETGKPFQGK
ncbi:MAG: DNA modification methylase [Pseudomonadales bacterium]